MIWNYTKITIYAFHNSSSLSFDPSLSLGILFRCTSSFPKYVRANWNQQHKKVLLTKLPHKLGHEEIWACRLNTEDFSTKKKNWVNFAKYIL